jgi:hypothetical protein
MRAQMTDTIVESKTTAPERLHALTQWMARFDAYDVATVLLLGALTITALCTFRDYAISNDEGVQHHYSELIIAYYKSHFADHSVFHFENLYLYGGLFDIIAVALSQIVPVDPYDLRHIHVCPYRHRWNRRRSRHGASRRRPAGGPDRGDFACGLRRLVRCDVQSYQGYSAGRRDDRRNLFPLRAAPSLPRPHPLDLLGLRRCSSCCRASLRDPLTCGAGISHRSCSWRVFRLLAR